MCTQEKWRRMSREGNTQKHSKAVHVHIDTVEQTADMHNMGRFYMLYWASRTTHSDVCALHGLLDDIQAKFTPRGQGYPECTRKTREEVLYMVMYIPDTLL